ncbi:ABC transporter ATP-binding protein [Natrialbaceae archaeon A-CW3]
MEQSSPRSQSSSTTRSQPSSSTRSSRRARPPAESTSTTPILDARGLTKTYGRGDDVVRAVDGIDLAVERGTVVGLLGPNGAGKTTTIKMLLGLIVPDAGSVTIDGTDPIAHPSEGYRSVSAMLEGARNVYWRLTVRENLRFFARLGDRPADPDRIEAVIDSVGLAEKADTTVNELSRGMKQKASLACTLIRETPLSFLDEPTLGLDVESSLELRRQLRRLVEDESRTVVLSSHDMDVIEAVCDRVVIMNEGRIVADGSIDELVDVFRTQSYRITLEGRISQATKRALEAQFGATDWIDRGRKQRVDVPHVQGAEFYELMDVLRESEARLLTVDAIEPDLEDVFLELTGESGTDDTGAEIDGHGRTTDTDGGQRATDTDGGQRATDTDGGQRATDTDGGQRATDTDGDQRGSAIDGGQPDGDQRVADSAESDERGRR